MRACLLQELGYNHAYYSNGSCSDANCHQPRPRCNAAVSLISAGTKCMPQFISAPACNLYVRTDQEAFLGLVKAPLALVTGCRGASLATNLVQLMIHTGASDKDAPVTSIAPFCCHRPRCQLPMER